MAYRYGRIGVNQENEQRRLQREPVVIWKKEWMLPSGGATGTEGVKILNWVRTGDYVKFDQFEENILGEETVAAMEMEPSSDLTSVPVVEIIQEATPLATTDALHEQPVTVEQDAAAIPPPVTEEGGVQSGAAVVEPPTDVPANEIAVVAAVPEDVLPPVEVSQPVLPEALPTQPAATTMADMPVESDRSALDAPTFSSSEPEQTDAASQPVSSIPPPELL